MKFIIAMGTVLGLALSSFAAPQRTRAKITKVETFLTGTLLWLERIEGYQLPTGSSGHFDQTANTRLVLADGHTFTEGRKAMLAAALTAFATGTSVWFYWYTETGEIQSLMPVTE